MAPRVKFPRKPPAGKPSHGEPSRGKPAAQWHAVEIRSGANACEAAKANLKQRFLAREAPLLPLRDCDRRQQCECKYRHHDDRRAGPRREDEGARPVGGLPDQDDRRYMSGRREEDRDDWERQNRPQDDFDLSDTYYEFVNRSAFKDPDDG